MVPQVKKKKQVAKLKVNIIEKFGSTEKIRTSFFIEHHRWLLRNL